jgi:hypothetical protein
MDLTVSHEALAIILALAALGTVAGLSFMACLVYRSERHSARHFAQMEERFERHFAEMQRLTKAVAGLVYQEEEKTRALLREHGWP